MDGRMNGWMDRYNLLKEVRKYIEREREKEKERERKRERQRETERKRER